MTGPSCFTFENNTIYKYLCSISDIVIPSKINEMPVSKIGYRAFANKKLTSIEIPNPVEIIGDHAFSYNHLIKVEIPNSVIKIGSDAFFGNNLLSVKIPNPNTMIGYGAFMPEVKIER